MLTSITLEGISLTPSYSNSVETYDSYLASLFITLPWKGYVFGIYVQIKIHQNTPNFVKHEVIWKCQITHSNMKYSLNNVFNPGHKWFLSGTFSLVHFDRE